MGSKLQLQWDSQLSVKLKEESITVDLPSEIHVPYWKRNTVINLVSSKLLGNNYHDIILQANQHLITESLTEKQTDSHTGGDVPLEDLPVNVEIPIQQQPQPYANIYPALPALTEQITTTPDNPIPNDPPEYSLDMMTFGSSPRKSGRVDRRASIRRSALKNRPRSRSEFKVQLTPIIKQWR